MAPDTGTSQTASATPSPSAPAAAPLFGPAALAILGSMLFLIVALSAMLVQTTWASAAAQSAPTAEVYESPDLAQR